MRERELSNHGESAPPAEPETFEAYVRRKLREHDEQLEEHEELIGQEASNTRKTPATGLHAGIDELRGEMQKLGSKVDRLSETIEADRLAREQAVKTQKEKREPWSWALKLAVGTAISTTVGAALVALGAFIARHWTP